MDLFGRSELHGPSMVAVKAKILECSLNNPALSLLIKHLVIGQRQTAPNRSAFHWSAHSSLVSIVQHFVTTNINTNIEIVADLNTESDQAMRAVHSCNSWFSCLTELGMKNVL